MSSAEPIQTAVMDRERTNWFQGFRRTHPESRELKAGRTRLKWSDKLSCVHSTAAPPGTGPAGAARACPQPALAKMADAAEAPGVRGTSAWPLRGDVLAVTVLAASAHSQLILHRLVQLRKLQA